MTNSFDAPPGDAVEAARGLTPQEGAARKVAYGTLASSPMPDVVRKIFVARVAEAISAAERRGAEAEREECARLAEHPYGDEVQAIAGDEPKAVGLKVAAAIRARGTAAEEKGEG